MTMSASRGYFTMRLLSRLPGVVTARAAATVVGYRNQSILQVRVGDSASREHISTYFNHLMVIKVDGQVSWYLDAPIYTR
jgi:hypothetical protein